MISRQVLSRLRRGLPVRSFSSAAPKIDPKWDVFPREREGNEYSVNFSVLEDGITSTGDCFRNARLALLASRLPVKPTDGIVKVSSPKLVGEFKMTESGDSISHEDFGALKREQDELLSSGADLFVEDASVGAAASVRVGVRIYTQNPATALAFRKLLVPTPERPLDHRARFEGWNEDERWRASHAVWNEQSQQYDVSDRPANSQGSRPLGAFIGGNHNNLAIQFVERGGSIVGSNIVAGEQVPLRGVVESLCTAGVVLVNAQPGKKVALNSTSFVKGDSTFVVVNCSDKDTEAIAKKSGAQVYGMYGNVLTESGVSAMFNGRIGAAGAASNSEGWTAAVPAVESDSAAVHSSDPANMINPASAVYIIDSSAEKGSTQLTGEAATKRLLAVVENDAKEEAVQALFAKSKVYVVKSASDVN